MYDLQHKMVLRPTTDRCNVQRLLIASTNINLYIEPLLFLVTHDRISLVPLWLYFHVGCFYILKIWCCSCWWKALWSCCYKECWNVHWVHDTYNYCNCWFLGIISSPKVCKSNSHLQFYVFRWFSSQLEQAS